MENKAPMMETVKWEQPAQDFWDIQITERLEEQLARLSRYEALCIMTANNAHDFNNLLTIIEGNLQLIKMNLQDKDWRLKKWTEQIEDALKQARKLALHILHTSRDECTVKKVCCIKEMLKSSGTIALSSRNIMSIFSIEEDLWQVYVDENQISQVVINLIMNAIQATAEGGKMWIEAANEVLEAGNFAQYEPGQYIRITIRDKGRGIPPEHRDNLFTPFFTTKKNGTGLGLSSCYSIIKNHNGYISFSSRVNRGTIFNVYLPAVLP